ncbi:MAG TPA: ATP-binding protein [Myxococcota bacterium]|nr:ATP-binding protein [Myxococcota bacterium]
MKAERISVELKKDHLERLAAKKNPIQAIAELIWNSVDGDATRVNVALVENDMGGIDEIRVEDNGVGVSHDLAKSTFGSLGSSWKKGKSSNKGRRLHGSEGEGRFSAYCLGSKVEWISRFQEDGNGVREFRITGSDLDMGVFEVFTPEKSDQDTGTTVVVTNIGKNHPSLFKERADIKLTEIFALYMRNYGDIQIKYDGRKIDPSQVESYSADYEIGPVAVSEGRSAVGKLTVIEWDRRVERSLVLCDSGGFALVSTKPRIQATGFYFSAYLQSALVEECKEKGTLDIADLDTDLQLLIDAARDKLRAHFRERTAALAKSVVGQWKEEKVYPYEGTPRDVVEEAERQMFDVLALNINDYLPDFSDSDRKSKKLSLRMLRTAIESSPQEARRIIQEVLDLPKDKQEELADLLEKTTLSSIINASKVVVDRLAFIQGLEVILFDPIGRQKLKERKQLHRILAKNTWIFGEEFNLSVDDQSLTSVLKKHLALLGKDRKELAPVNTLDGKKGIVDLMLSKRIRQPRPREIEHLVVELKRPNQKIDSDVTTQIKKYALAVATDERFYNTNARWTFWAISNDLDTAVDIEVNRQKNNPPGQLMDLETPSIVVWVKTWSEILNDCKARLQFYQKNLGYSADADDGLALMKNYYQKYLPQELSEEGD